MQFLIYVPIARPRTECPKLLIALLGDGVPQEDVYFTCICMDTQIGKFFNTSHMQVFDFFGRIFDNDT